MRMDRGFRRRAVVLAALLAASTPAPAAVAALPAGPPPASPPGRAHAGPGLVAFAPGRPIDDPLPAQPEPVTEAGRAAALAEPAIVQVDVRWEGYVRDRETGELLDADPVSVSAQCTGAGVGHDGYLLTTRSCLEQSAVTVDAFRQVIQRWVADGRIPGKAADEQLTQLLARARIGADVAGDDPPERSISVRRAVTDDEPLPASLVASADPDDGDAALLKISRSNQPVLSLAGEDDLALGTELVTAQCEPEPVEAAATTAPPGGAGTGEQPLQPAFHTGTVTATTPRVLVEPDEPAGPATRSAGGVVLTYDAAIAGLVDTNLAAGEVLVDLDTIRELLAEADVDTEPGQVDQDYRAGLDAYYAGRYGDAIERFDSVLAIIPSHLQAHQYRASAQSLRDDRDEPPPPGDEVVDTVESWLGGRSWSLVGVLVLIAIVVFLVQRRRPDAVPQAPPADGAAAPEEPYAELPAAETPHDAGRR